MALATTMNPYIGILVLFIAAAGFALTMLALSYGLGPKNPTRTKQLPFECGSVPVGNVQDQRFQVRYYLIAMLFILFDIEVIFMYPWAVSLTEIGWSGFWHMVFFVAVLSVGLAFVWKKGLFRWNE